MAEKTLQKGKQLVKEFKLEHSGIAKKWMAYYLGDLLEKEDFKDEDEETNHKELCKNLILDLWNRKFQEDKMDLERSLGQKQPFHQDSSETNKDQEILQDFLKKPGNFKVKNNEQARTFLESLKICENAIIQLVWIINMEKSENHEELTESDKILYDFEILHEAYSSLIQDYFPDFSEISNKDWKIKIDFLRNAKNRIREAEDHLIWR
jgi:hypothetical protein